MLETDKKTVWLRFGIGAIGAALVMILIAAIVIGAVSARQIRDVQESRAGQVASNDRTLAIIRGCTTPGRACYERAQRQSAKAISNINRVAIIAAACASGSQTRTVEEIQTCVIARLTARKPR